MTIFIPLEDGESADIVNSIETACPHGSIFASEPIGDDADPYEVEGLFQQLALRQRKALQESAGVQEVMNAKAEDADL
jgi:hypothetical protein